MRFGRNHAARRRAGLERPVGGLARACQPVQSTDPHSELFVRYARKDGRLVAILRAVEQAGSCVVEAEVHPHGKSQLVRPGPYTFADAHEASAFVTEAVTALIYLGCDVQAQ